MKHILKNIFLFIYVSVLFTMSLFMVSASSTGEGNVDGGGGANDLQGGTSQNNWIPGNDGVRITIVDAETGTTMFTPIDWARRSQTGKTIIHYGKYSKISYLAGKSLSFKGDNYDVHYYLFRNWYRPFWK